MGFRITTNMMMNTYKFNLQNNTQKLANARDMVLTQRNFNSYEEAPPPPPGLSACAGPTLAP